MCLIPVLIEEVKIPLRLSLPLQILLLLLLEWRSVTISWILFQTFLMDFTRSTEFLCTCFWILTVSFGIYWLQIASFTAQYIVEIFSCQYMSMLYPFKMLQCVPFFIYDWTDTGATGWMFVSLNLYCCSVAQSCPTLCNPMDCSTPASLSFTISWSLFKLMSTGSVMSSNQSRPLSSASPPTFSISRHHRHGTVCSGRDMGAAWMSIRRLMGERAVVHKCNGVLLSH